LVQVRLQPRLIKNNGRPLAVNLDLLDCATPSHFAFFSFGAGTVLGVRSMLLHPTCRQIEQKFIISHPLSLQIMGFDAENQAVGISSDLTALFNRVLAALTVLGQ